MNTGEDITIEDLNAVINALDGWLDAFAEDDVFDEATINGVRKVLKKMESVVSSMTSEHRHLRLVKDTKKPN